MRIGDGYTGPDLVSTSAWVSAAVVLSIGLALTGAATLWQQQNARGDAQEQLDRQVERLQADVVKRLSMPVYGLKGARGTIAAQGGKLSRAAFRAYVESRDLPKEFPGTRGFGFIEPVPREAVAAFTEAQRRDGAPDFAVRSTSSEPMLYVVTRIEPLAKNAAAVGLDVAREPVRRQAIDQAITSGDAALSSPITLVQDSKQGPGFLMLVPVFRDTRDPGTPEARRAALLGLLYAPLLTEELLHGSADAAAAMLDLRLSVRTVDDGFVPLLGTQRGKLLGPVDAADIDFSSAPMAETRSFVVAGREFQLEAALTQETAAGMLGLSCAELAAGGALLSVLLAVTVYLLAASRARAEAMAHGMTADLERLARVARHTTNAVFITGPDHRVSWINEGFTRLTGYTADEVIGKDPGALLKSELADRASERKLRDAVAAGEGCQVELINRAKDGHDYWVAVEIQPLHDDTGALGGYMVIESDITVRKQLQAQAEEARQSLQDLYDNAPCAYYSLDPQGRFLQINAVGLAWFGCTAEEAIGRLRSADFLTDQGRALFAEHFPRFKVEGHLTGLELDLIGRHGPPRRVSLSATAVYDSDGRFQRSRTVMFDITETHEIRQRLHQLSSDQEAMLESDLVGIVKLKNRKVLWRNRALERMFGYDDGELLGTAARILYADDTAYETLGALAYPQLRAGARFRTQVQMRRKDATLIWVDLSGIELPGDEGASLWMMVDITQSKAYEARMERAALHDALTGLPNRLLLSDRLQQALHSAQRSSHVFALAYLDLNGFKQINDTHGHDAGDEVLKAVAARLQAGLRASDTVARLGGDEFIVLFTPSQGPAEVEPVLNRLLDALVQPITLSSGAKVAVGTSIGLAHYPADGDTAAELMRHADEAMFSNKRAGRSRALTR